MTQADSQPAETGGYRSAQAANPKTERGDDLCEFAHGF